MALLEDILQTFLSCKPLASKYHGHPLTGNYAGFWECHILPNWLLVYIIGRAALLLVASRTGTHFDLFGKQCKTYVNNQAYLLDIKAFLAISEADYKKHCLKVYNTFIYISFYRNEDVIIV